MPMPVEHRRRRHHTFKTQRRFADQGRDRGKAIADQFGTGGWGRYRPAIERQQLIRIDDSRAENTIWETPVECEPSSNALNLADNVSPSLRSEMRRSRPLCASQSAAIPALSAAANDAPWPPSPTVKRIDAFRLARGTNSAGELIAISAGGGFRALLR
jgi:hypothetical protein